MPRKLKVDPTALVKQTRPDVILRSAALCDGHSILKPEALVEAGLPPEVVAHVSTTYQSDLSDPKSTLFVQGQPVQKLHGVYGLHLLEFLARALGVQYEGKLGRGSQARAIQEALHSHFSERGRLGGA